MKLATFRRHGAVSFGAVVLGEMADLGGRDPDRGGGAAIKEHTGVGGLTR
jgi:hypothetical protein